MEDKKENKPKESKINYNELLKYPIVTICIVAGLYCGTIFMGLDLSEISSISPQGIEFKKKQAQASSEAMAALQNKISVLEQSLSEVAQKQAAKVPQRQTDKNSKPAAPSALRNDDGTETPPVTNIQPLDYTTTENADASVAQLSFINIKGDTYLKGKTGYIWLGEFNKTNHTWKSMSLQFPDNKKAINDDPTKISKQQYRTTRDIVFRNEPLTKNNDNLQGNLVGAIPQGVLILLQDITNVDNQYWGKITVED